VIEVPVPRPRTREQFASPLFLETKRHLEALIHTQAEAEDAQLTPLVRMTEVGDDVE
jgi:NitT/TauT family transport system ATP-binding protein